MSSPDTCDWCGKGQAEIKQLTVSTGLPWLKPPKPEACICDECVELLAMMMATEHPDWRDQLLAKLTEMARPV